MGKRIAKKTVANNVPAPEATFGETIKNKVASIINNRPLSVLKGIGAFALFLSLGFNIVSTVAVYGMYRFSNSQWLDTSKQWLVSIYNLTIGLFTKVKATQLFQNISQSIQNFTINFFTKKPNESQSSYNLRLLIGGVLGAVVGLQIVFNGVSALLFVGIRAIQFAAVATGCSAVYQDIKYAIENPKNALHSIGSAIGNGFKYCVNAISNLFGANENEATPPAKPATEIANINNNETNDLLESSLKWFFGIIASATPLILMSPGGAELIALSGGSVLAATGLIVPSLMVSVGGLFAAGFGGKYVLDKLTGNDTAVQRPKIIELPDVVEVEQTKVVKLPANRKAKAVTHEKADDVAKPAAKTITPRFEKHQEKAKAQAQKRPVRKAKAKKTQSEQQPAAPKSKGRTLAK